MKILDRLEKSKNFWFLLIASFIFFLLRLPSVFEPNWYGDEGIYQVLGMGVNHGRVLYEGIFDNKPPLLYLLYALFNGEHTWLRAFNLVSGVLTLIAFFYMAKELFVKKVSAILSIALFLVLFATPYMEGNIANAENFILLPVILSGLIILKSLEAIKKKAENYRRVLFFAGLLVGIGFLFKIVALFDFAAFFIFLIFIDSGFELKKLKNLKYIFYQFDKLSTFILGFLAPVLLTALYFLIIGAFGDFITASFFSNIGYVGWKNKLIIPQGFLILKIIILLGFLAFLLTRKKTINFSSAFIYIWLTFSLFNAFFSQRPYTHYSLVFLPSIVLTIGLLFDNQKLRKFTLLVLVISLILIFKGFKFHNKTIYYYQNFGQFALGEKSTEEYFNFFDRNTNRDYRLAEYISENTSDTDDIFIWGNNAQLYKMTNKIPPGKYTVAYHISGYKDGISNTKQGLEKAQPKLIIVMPNVSSYPLSLYNYNLKAVVRDAYIYEKSF